MRDWSAYERASERGPLQIALMGIATLAVLIAVVWGIGSVFGWFGEAASVVREEFGPRAMLQKYEWFKDAAAQLEKKRADIEVYDRRLDVLEFAYTGKPRSAWPRDDREQYNIWAAEVAGVKASFNTLAADYNAQMAKFNWRFANAGELPPGANEPLPREFKSYIGGWE